MHTSAYSLGVDGVWQPSYAYNGKIPWYNGTLTVEPKHIRFQTKGVISEEWKVLDSDQSIDTGYFNVLVSKKGVEAIFRFEINSKYQCAKKSKFSYDKDCTDHDQKSPFRLLICTGSILKELETKTCKVRERYFDFDSNLKKKIDAGKYL